MPKKTEAKKTEKSETPMMVRVSTLKEFIKGSSDVNVSGEFAEAVNEHVAKAVQSAIERCTGNGRKTVRAVDL